MIKVLLKVCLFQDLGAPTEKGSFGL